jgi:predicted dehydrogenase/threonine dehydrogenase-like Zn-dependent dehydrogenase
MKQVINQGGQAELIEVPAPFNPACNILVRTHYSCISTGTELKQLKQRALPLWRKALNKPEHIRKAINIVSSEGVRPLLDQMQEKVFAPLPTGYSLAGQVVEVGSAVTEFAVGDLVACAGAQCAFHAEFVSVPLNLAVKIPQGLAAREASSVALGAIALQGIRRLEPTMGETFVVIGLGILGQLSCQMLRANGCRVIAVDLDEQRLALAKKLGATFAVTPGQDIVKLAELHTQGVGVDGVLITASGTAEEIISLAFKSCRKKGRVVLVGEVPLQLKREDLYEKELDFRVSCSYGPGRYDSTFEEGGADYPIAFVRWTETRNMEAYLNLLAAGSIQLTELLQSEFPLQEATAAFKALAGTGEMSALLKYPDSSLKPTRTVHFSESQSKQGRIGLAVVGTGRFFTNTHLPLLKEAQNQVQITSVCSRQGLSAQIAAKRLNAATVSTDYTAALEDKNTDAVLFCTKHESHAAWSLQALQKGKHVFVEKPLALESKELAQLEEFFANDKKQKPILMTGFNRRFSPAALAAKSALKSRNTPAILNYSFNAGFLPANHWVHGKEGGGRNLGEACHAYDLILFLLDAGEPTKITATSVTSKGGIYRADDNFSATLSFADGSIATLTYNSMGNAQVSKERIEIFNQGNIIAIDNFKQLAIHSANGKTSGQNFTSKGHKEEWQAFVKLVRGEKIDYRPADQFIATRIALAVQDQILRPIG